MIEKEDSQVIDSATESAIHLRHGQRRWGRSDLRAESHNHRRVKTPDAAPSDLRSINEYQNMQL